MKPFVLCACAAVALASPSTIKLTRRSMTEADFMNGVQRRLSLMKESVASRLRGAAPPVIPLRDITEYEYIAQISVGTPPQTFPIIPDTGSSNLWIYSSNCTAEACLTHPRFDCKSSSSCVNLLNSSLFVPYGSGIIAGDQVNDTVNVGGIQVASQTLGEVDLVMGNAFDNSPMSGLMGLAYPIIAMGSPPPLPVFDQMMAQGLVENDYFQFFLNAPNGSNDSAAMVIGGTDEAYCKGGSCDWTKVPFNVLQPLLGFWLITVDAITVGSGGSKIVSDACKGCGGVVDTGTSIVMIDDKKMVDLVTPFKNCSNVADLPTMTFTISGKPFDLTPDTYVIRIPASEADDDDDLSTSADGDQIVCIPGIMSGSVGMPGLMILGDTFMRAYTATFDRSTDQVWFAPSAAAGHVTL